MRSLIFAMLLTTAHEKSHCESLPEKSIQSRPDWTESGDGSLR